MKKKIALSLACAVVLNAADLGTISVESSTIDQKVDAQTAEVSNVAILTASDIERINPKSVADILQTIPGVTMTLSGTDSLKVHIRGIDNQMYMGEKPGVAIVIDGVPVQETTGKINVDLDNIESIKVIKGGASYLYGNDAIAGAVIITTKRQKGDKSSYKVEAETGSFGYERYLVSTNQAFESGALQIQGSQTNSDGYWDDAFVKSKNINGKYQHYINDTSDITIGADYIKRETGDGNSVSGVTMAYENPTSIYDPNDSDTLSYGGYYNSDLTKTFITYNNDLSDDSNFMLRVHSYEDDKNYKLARRTKDNYEVWDQSGAKGEYRTKLGQFALMGGFDIQRNDTDEVSYAYVDLYKYNYTTHQNELVNNAGDLLAQYKTKENINALYTEVKHQTTQNLISTLNLRYDDISHEYEDKIDITNNVSPDYTTMSYRLGFNYSLNKNQEFYTSVSTGFRTPTVGQISTNQTLLASISSNVDTSLIPTSIDIEKTYNYEIGFKGKTESNLAYNASIYQLDRKDYIGKIAGSYVDIVAYKDDTEDAYGNLGDMRSRGFELAINSDKSKMFSYDLAYTYLEAKFTNYAITREVNGVDTRVDFSGNYVSRSPKHTANLAMNYKATDKLTISPEVYYKGEYYADEANQFEQGGYTLVNLKVNYNHSKSLEFFVKIDNVMDKTYWEFVNVTSSTDTATMEDATIRVAEPRAYYAGLRYKF